MKPILFWTGYIMLLLSCSMLDVQIFALLAMPLFLLSAILFSTFHVKLVNDEKRGSGFSVFLASLGSILVAGFSAYGAIEYSEFYASSRYGLSGPAIPLPLEEKQFALIAIGLIAGSLLILLGLKMSKRFTGKRLLLVWIPTIIVFPLIMLLIAFWTATGFPVGSG